MLSLNTAEGPGSTGISAGLPPGKTVLFKNEHTENAAAIGETAIRHLSASGKWSGLLQSALNDWKRFILFVPVIKPNMYRPSRFIGGANNLNLASLL